MNGAGLAGGSAARDDRLRTPAEGGKQSANGTEIRGESKFCS